MQPTSDKVCDFCKRPNPYWAYPCADFVMPIIAIGNEVLEVNWASQGEWAACETCADYIESNDLDSLAFLLSGIVATKGQDPSPETEYVHGVLYGATKQLYQSFSNNRKGARVLA